MYVAKLMQNLQLARILGFRGCLVFGVQMRYFPLSRRARAAARARNQGASMTKRPRKNNQATEAATAEVTLQDRGFGLDLVMRILDFALVI